MLDSVKSITVSNGTYWSERVKWQIEGWNLSFKSKILYLIQNLLFFFDKFCKKSFPWVLFSLGHFLKTFVIHDCCELGWNWDDNKYSSCYCQAMQNEFPVLIHANSHVFIRAWKKGKETFKEVIIIKYSVISWQVVNHLCKIWWGSQVREDDGERTQWYATLVFYYFLFKKKKKTGLIFIVVMQTKLLLSHV